MVWLLHMAQLLNHHPPLRHLAMVESLIQNELDFTPLPQIGLLYTRSDNFTTIMKTAVVLSVFILLQWWRLHILLLWHVKYESLKPLNYECTIVWLHFVVWFGCQSYSFIPVVKRSCRFRLQAATRSSLIPFARVWSCYPSTGQCCWFITAILE